MGCFSSKSAQEQPAKTNTLLDAAATKGSGERKDESTKEASNIKRVQDLVAEFMSGRPEGYMVGVADNVKASMLGGLIPGADNIQSKADFAKVMGETDKYIEVKKFEPCNWRAVGDDVLFNVNWEFVWKATGKTVVTTAIVRKVLKKNMICEKYHMVDVEQVTGEIQPEAATVKRVRELLAEFTAGRPEGYMAGVADDVKASMLGGLIPGADNIQNKAEFAKIMVEIDKYMDIKKFEPCNFRACPNNDMMFNVSWEFVWKATGKTVATTAIVRKVLKDDMICEKYHMVDVDQITAAQEAPKAATSQSPPETGERQEPSSTDGAKAGDDVAVGTDALPTQAAVYDAQAASATDASPTGKSQATAAGTFVPAPKTAIGSSAAAELLKGADASNVVDVKGSSWNCFQVCCRPEAEIVVPEK